MAWYAESWERKPNTVSASDADTHDIHVWLKAIYALSVLREADGAVDYAIPVRHM
jgi:hypothetical protein